MNALPKWLRYWLRRNGWGTHYVPTHGQYHVERLNSVWAECVYRARRVWRRARSTAQ